MKKKNKFVFIKLVAIVIAAILFAVACNGNGSDPGGQTNYVPATGITLTGVSGTVGTNGVDAGSSLTFSATVQPADADQRFTVIISGATPAGVTIDGNTINVADTVTHNTRFTVAIHQTANPLIFYEVGQFTVLGDSGMAITTPLTLRLGANPIAVAITPADMNQAFTLTMGYVGGNLLDLPAGASITGNAFNVPWSLAHGTQVLLRATANAVEDGSLYVQEVFTVDNDPTMSTQTILTGVPDGFGGIELVSKEYYMVSTETQLRHIARNSIDEQYTANLAKNFMLANDIALTSRFTPIGGDYDPNVYTANPGFSGIFDGNGFSIKNLHAGSLSWNSGFFSKVDAGGIIRNVSFIGGIEGSEAAHANGIHMHGLNAGGVVVGFLYGTVENVFVNVSAINSAPLAAAHTAMIAGSLRGATSVVRNSISVGQAHSLLSNNIPTNNSGIVGNAPATNPYIRTPNSFVLDTSVSRAFGNNANEFSQVRRTAAELRSEATFDQWDRTIWNIREGHLPELRNGNSIQEMIAIINYSGTPVYVPGTLGQPALLDVEVEFRTNAGFNVENNADGRDFTVAVTPAVDGISVAGNTVTVNNGVTHLQEFVVVATSETISDSRVFIVDNLPRGLHFISQISQAANDTFEVQAFARYIDGGFTVEVVPAVDGITVTDRNITIGDLPHDTPFTVVITSTADSEITATREFRVFNATLTIDTPAGTTMTYNPAGANTLQLAYSTIPIGSDVTFTLLPTVDRVGTLVVPQGVTVHPNTGLVTIDANSNNRQEFTVRAALVIDPTVTAEIVITVINEEFREIHTMADLLLLSLGDAVNHEVAARYWNNYILMSDIDISSVSRWAPIGHTTSWNGIYPAEFNGIFDGNGFVIRGMTRDFAAGGWFWNAGLFARVGEYGVIRNLGVESGATFGSIQGGAIVSQLFGRLENSWANVHIGSSATNAQVVASLVHTVHPGASVINSYAIGMTNPLSDAGLYGPRSAFINANNGTVESSFVLEETLFRFDSGGRSLSNIAIVLGAGSGAVNAVDFFRTEAQMQDQATFVGWDFVNIWEMPVGGGFPQLRNNITR